MGKTGEGAARFVCGLCKKVLIADSLAPLVSALQNISETAAKAESAVTTGIRAEGAGIGTLGYWVLALAFMLQLYYDFPVTAIWRSDSENIRFYVPGEFQVSFYLKKYLGVLAQMAHDAGRLVPRLPLYPTGRQPGERSAMVL